MNRKIIFSLILFIGVFFAFGMKVKAIDCTLYGYTNDEHGDATLDNSKKLQITNFGNASTGIVTIGDINIMKVSYLGYSTAFNQLIFRGEIEANKCPGYVKITVNYTKPYFYINVTASAVRNFDNPGGLLIGEGNINGNNLSAEEFSGMFMNENEAQNIQDTADSEYKCKYTNESNEKRYLKIVSGRAGLYNGLSEVTNYSDETASKLENYANSCPTNLYYANISGEKKYFFSGDYTTEQIKNLVGSGEMTIISKYSLSSGNPSYENESTAPIQEYIGIGGDPVKNTCEGILGQDFIEFLKEYIFTPIKIVAPILLLIFTTLDFAKAVFTDDKDALKKAQSNFVKRTIAVILLFLLTYILDLIFTIFTNGMIDTCFK